MSEVTVRFGDKISFTDGIAGVSIGANYSLSQNVAPPFGSNCSSSAWSCFAGAVISADTAIMADNFNDYVTHNGQYRGLVCDVVLDVTVNSPDGAQLYDVNFVPLAGVDPAGYPTGVHNIPDVSFPDNNGGNTIALNTVAGVATTGDQTFNSIELWTKTGYLNTFTISGVSDQGSDYIVYTGVWDTPLALGDVVEFNYDSVGNTYADSAGKRIKTISRLVITNCADPSSAVGMKSAWAGNYQCQPNLRHFWSCEETGTPTTVEDVVGGADITSGLTVFGGNPANAVRMTVASSNVLDGPITQPGEFDFIAFSCGRSTQYSDSTGFSEAGFYYGGADGWVVVHSYISRMGLCYAGAMVPPYASGDVYTRLDGELYGSAFVRRGNLIQHYSNDLLDGAVPGAIAKRGEVDPSTVSIVSPWPDITGIPDKLYLGHGAMGIRTSPLDGSENICDPDTNRSIGIYNPPQPAVTFASAEGGSGPFDYYGLCFLLFPEGLPDDATVLTNLNQMMSDWAAGNKVVPPEWST